MTNQEILEKHGWTIVCESPFTIEEKDGSSAVGLAAYIVLGEYSREEKKKKKVLEKDLKNWDVYESPNGNVFIKFGNKYSIAIGSEKLSEPKKRDVFPNGGPDLTELYLPVVECVSETLKVKKIGKVKFKK